MANLHLIAFTVEADELDTAIKRQVTPGDSLLFISDSVLSLLDPSCTRLLTNHPVYALRADVRCRGILPSQPIQLICDEELVKLSISHNQIISW